MKLSLDVVGLRETEDNIARVILGADKVVARELYTQAEIIMTLAKREFVPVLTGTLRDSGYVEEPRSDSAGVYVVLGFGGPARAYALYQHERVDLHHTVGGPKYLEEPLMRRAPDVRAAVSVAMDAFMGKV